MSETQETPVWSLGLEDPLQWDVAAHSVLLLGKLHGQRNLVSYSPKSQIRLGMHAYVLWMRADDWTLLVFFLSTRKKEKQIRLVTFCPSVTAYFTGPLGYHTSVAENVPWSLIRFSSGSCQQLDFRHFSLPPSPSLSLSLTLPAFLTPSQLLCLKGSSQGSFCTSCSPIKFRRNKNLIWPQA